MTPANDNRTLYIQGQPHRIITKSGVCPSGWVSLGVCPMGSSGVHSVHKLPNHWYQNPYGRIFATGKYYSFKK